MFTAVKQYFKSTSSLSTNTFMYGLLALIVILGPLFFIPSKSLSIGTSKGFFIILTVLIGFLVYSIYILKKGVITIPRHPLFYILMAIVGTSFLGALLAPSFGTAFFGYGYETTTWLFIAVFSLLVFFSYRIISSYERLAILYGGMLGAFSVLWLLHFIRYLVGGGFANLGILWNTTSTLIGAWSDLAIFAGFIVLFCAITLELAGLKKTLKIILGSILGLGLLMLLIMNISVVWSVLGFVSLFFVLYLFSFAFWDPEHKVFKRSKRVPWAVVAVFVVSLIGVFFGNFFNLLAGHHQNLIVHDIRPSFSMTTRTFEQSLGHNFLTGFGPSGFSDAWSLAKPPALSSVNNSSVDFVQGSGFIPTQIATNGILGAIVWILFTAVTVAVLIRKTRQGFENPVDRYFMILVGMSIVYLGVMVWVYAPGIYLLSLFAILIGAFMGVVSRSRADISVSFVNDPRTSFFGILLLTACAIGVLFAGYVELRKAESWGLYARGLTLANMGDTQDAEQLTGEAALVAGHDIYHQAYANLLLGDINHLAAAAGSMNRDVLAGQAEKLFGVALGHAQAAITENPASYKNWLFLGDVYQSMVSLGMSDAYQKAMDAYQQAKIRDPHDSTILLSFAQLEFANNNSAQGFKDIADSINLYPTEGAYVLRGRMQMSGQDWVGAIASWKAAINFDPNNPTYYVLLAVAYDESGDSVSATALYNALRNEFKDVDAVIAEVKNQYTAPVATPLITPKTSPKKTAPTKKK